MEPNFQLIAVEGGVPIKAWNRGVPFEELAVEQLRQTARLPFVHPYVAAMPDVHFGIGATIGSVVPTKDAIVPAAVGVDIGCGMIAARTDVLGADLGKDLLPIRQSIEKVVPHGRTDDGGANDRGSWGRIPDDIQQVWEADFEGEYSALCEAQSGMRARNSTRQLGTLGTGNHFIELSTDETGQLWVVLHSGSRGLGNRIGSYFIQVAKKACAGKPLPTTDLAYLDAGTKDFDDYVRALHLAQRFAWRNRTIMLVRILSVLGLKVNIPDDLVHCHHNYMAEEEHFGEQLMITRKGAVRARSGDMGIIPGSMGAKSFIVRGLGSEHSFHSCSHGAGRRMGRNVAMKAFTVADHVKATEGVECHKGKEVLDETPGAYKDIDAVMAAQTDLVEVVHTLKQIVCVKGLGDGGKRHYGTE